MKGKGKQRLRGHTRDIFTALSIGKHLVGKNVAAGLRGWSLEDTLALRVTRQQPSASLNRSQKKEAGAFAPWGNEKEFELSNQCVCLLKYCRAGPEHWARSPETYCCVTVGKSLSPSALFACQQNQDMNSVSGLYQVQSPV